MGTYAIRKVAQIPVVLLSVTVFLFVLIQVAPGDPVAAYVGDAQVSPAYLAELREHLGLDRSVPAQLATYLGNVLTGDLGFSLHYQQPVLDVILARVPATLVLMASSLVLATLLGTGLGALAAFRPNSWVDSSLNFTMLFAYSLPVFWLGQLALLFFALQLGWLPTQGMQDLRAPATGFGAVLDLAVHLILPAAVLGTRYVAVSFRLIRTEVIDVLSQEYILTARSKGLANGVVVLRHALRNALLPLITVTGMNLGFALSGAALTEVIFGWPGIGRLTLDAITSRDYPVILGVFLIVTLFVVVMNFLTDIVCALVDPRIRLR